MRAITQNKVRATTNIRIILFAFNFIRQEQQLKIHILFSAVGINLTKKGVVKTACDDTKDYETKFIIFIKKMTA